jgi:hypothetical protein
MHREQFVVLLRGKQVVVGHRELQADEKCLHSSDEKKEERRNAVEQPDAFVIDSGEPAHKTRRRRRPDEEVCVLLARAVQRFANERMFR